MIEQIPNHIELLILILIPILVFAYWPRKSVSQLEFREKHKKQYTAYIDEDEFNQKQRKTLLQMLESGKISQKKYQQELRKYR